MDIHFLIMYIQNRYNSIYFCKILLHSLIVITVLQAVQDIKYDIS